MLTCDISLFTLENIVFWEIILFIFFGNLFVVKNI